MSRYSTSLTAVLDREPAGEITSREVDYVVEGVACSGYLALPAGDAPAPGVLVVHDWLGVSDYVRMRCDMIARLGYVAFAADIYGAGVRPTQREARDVAMSFYGDRPLLRTRVIGGFARLLEEPRVDTARTAAIGYCFGGSSVLELARTGADVGGVVTFHGGLMPGADGDDASAIRAKLLILHGAIDPTVPDEAVVAFENELRSAPDLDWQLVAYSGAMHAFTLPDANAPDFGAMYNPTAERRSWVAMKAFLSELFA